MTYFFKEYLKVLLEEKELKTISRSVDPNMEVTEITDREASLPEGGKALLFENTGTDFPIVTNLFSSKKRIALTFEKNSIEEVSKKIIDFYHAVTSHQASGRFARKPFFHELSQFFPRTTNVGSCQEVALFPPDLNRIPFLKNRVFDEAYSLHEVPMIIKNPISGSYAVDSARLLWHSRSTFQVCFEPGSFIGHCFNNSPMGRVPVAFFMGGDPLYSLSALILKSEKMEPFLLEGYIRNKAIVKAPCLSQPIEVPENCDLVIEGYIDKNAQMLTSAACGNNTGFYSIGGEEPLVHVTCITHRKGAYIPIITPCLGLQRTRYFFTQSLSAIAEATIESSFDQQVKKLYFPYFCTQCAVAIAGIHKFYPRQVQKTAHAFWGSNQYALNKLLILVDDHVDVQNGLEVRECIRKYYNPATDNFFSSGPLSVTDPAAPRRGYGGKICIDATRKRSASKASDSFAKEAFILYHKSGKVPVPDPSHSKILIALDDEVDLNNFFLCSWLAIYRTDPIRDIHIKEGILYVDATLKKAGDKRVTRPWPNVCCTSENAIKKVDGYWERLKIGDFVPSPSLKLQSFLRKGNAQIKE